MDIFTDTQTDQPEDEEEQEQANGGNAGANSDAGDEEQDNEPAPARLDTRPKNNLYAPGTGPGTGRTAIRVGTLNRDGSRSPLSPLGAATGPLSQPMPGLSAGAAPPVTRAQLNQSQQQQANGGNAGANSNAGQGNDAAPARLDTRPKNNLYAPGTGPGTGRTAIRVGTINRDGSRSPLSPLGAATGPLSQPRPGLLTPRPAPRGFAQQFASENAKNAKACAYERKSRQAGGRAMAAAAAPWQAGPGAAMSPQAAEKSCGIDAGDPKFEAAARAAMAEEAAGSPVAAALQKAAAKLNITIQRKRVGLAETITDKDGHTTIHYNPYAKTGATMSHELAHAIQQAAFHQVVKEVEQSGRKPAAKDIERAIQAGRDALNQIVPVKSDRDRGQDYKENEAMRVSRIVNAERTATRMKALPDEKKTAREFWKLQRPKEGGTQHQDNQYPTPPGTEYGRYDSKYVRDAISHDAKGVKGRKK